MIRRKSAVKIDWAILTLVCLAVFLFRFTILSKSQITFFSDDAIYASLARFFVAGEWQYVFHPYWQPLFPFLSAIAYLVVGQWEVALQLVSVIAGVALLIPLFILVKKTMSLLTAILFILFLGFLNPLLFVSLLPLSDSLSSLFIVSFSVIIFLGIEYKKIRFLYLGAFLIGLGYLTRSEGLMFFSLTIIFLVGYLLIQVLFRQQPTKILLRIPVFAFVFLLTISSYAIAMKDKLGNWTLSQKFSAQLLQDHSFALRGDSTVWAQEVYSIKEPNYNSYYFHSGIDYLFDNFNYFLSWFGQKILWWQGIFVEVFPIWSVLLMLLGVFSLLKKHFWGAFFFVLILLVAVPVTVFSVPIADVRYLLWTIPILFYLFFMGFSFIIKPIARRFSPIFWAVPFLAVTFFPAFSWPTILDPQSFASDLTRRYHRPYIVQVASWIKNDYQKEHPRIAMRYEALEFYTNGTTLYIPQISYDSFIDYAKINSADYIVAWGPELASDEKLSLLLDKSVAKPDLKEVYALDTPDGKIIVYKLVK